MRLVIAIGVVLFTSLAQPPQKSDEKVYASHTCPGGHSWYVVASDSDSVTIRCSADDESDASDADDSHPGLEEEWQRYIESNSDTEVPPTQPEYPLPVQPWHGILEGGHAVPER